MYCIISLPRTASTYALHLVRQSLMFTNPLCVTNETTSAFNPRYLTPQQIESKFNKIVNTTPLPLIKIISNHDFSMVDRIINSGYKTVFIKPADLRKQILKVLVAKKTDSFANKNVREKYVGTLEFTDEEILERLEFHRKHLEFEHQSDYVVEDSEILDNPETFINAIGLEYAGTKYKYTPYKYTDEQMMLDISLFYTQYERCKRLYDSTH
jgi:hypothetical protein